MLFKLLKSNIKLSGIIGSLVGALIGVIIFFSALQFYFDISPLLKGSNSLWRPDYIIVNKKVSTVGSIFNKEKKATFSASEIKEIKSQAFVKDIAEFSSNTFGLTAYSTSHKVPNLSSYLFFEAVPDKFLDVIPEGWQWDDEKLNQQVPVIVPKSYLNLYNFGFAESQGLPQISSEIAKEVPFRIRITTQNREIVEYDGKIAGFSERINSILVPQSFLKWANKEYGSFEKKSPSRLILVVDNPSNPEIFNYLNSKNYSINKEKLKSSRLNYFLSIISVIILVVGSTITILALWLLIMALIIAVQKSNEKIKNLIYIGYSISKISKIYISIIISINIIIIIFSLFFVKIIKNIYVNYIAKYEFELYKGLDFKIYIITILLFGAIIVVHSHIIKRQIKSIIKE